MAEFSAENHKQKQKQQQQRQAHDRKHEKPSKKNDGNDLRNGTNVFLLFPIFRGVFAERDIVQFVPMRDFTKNQGNMATVQVIFMNLFVVCFI